MNQLKSTSPTLPRIPGPDNFTPAYTGSVTYVVYILRCADGTLYTGVTNDIARRLAAHNGTSRGARYTRSRRPVALVYSARCRNRSDAQRREAALKRLTRAQKLAIVTAARRSTAHQRHPAPPGTVRSR
jgi:putative endonuclease